MPRKNRLGAVSTPQMDLELLNPMWQIPSVKPYVDKAIDGRMSRVERHAGKLDQYAHSRGILTPSPDVARSNAVSVLGPDKGRLVSNLRESAQARVARVGEYASVLRNPVASPRLQMESKPFEFMEEDGLDDLRESTRVKSFRQEPGVAMRARQYFGIPDPYAQGAGKARGILGVAQRTFDRFFPQPADMHLSAASRLGNKLLPAISRLRPLLRILPK